MIYYDIETRQFSMNPNVYGNYGLNAKINHERDKRDRMQHKLNKAELKLQDRSAFTAWRNRQSALALGTRLRNWKDGTGFRGDVRANKLARLQKKQDRSRFREEYNFKEKDRISRTPDRLDSRDGIPTI